MIPFLNSFFYQIKPMVSRRLQIEMRRTIIRLKRKRVASHWPIRPQAAEKPNPWHGWPDEKRFALVLTHDVETAKGQENCSVLMNIENSWVFILLLILFPKDIMFPNHCYSN